MTETATTTDAPTLPPPPRAMTPRARRRSWSEAPVRVWTILTAIVAVVAVYLAIAQTIEGVFERRLVYGGIPVQARIIALVNRDTRATERREGPPARLSYTIDGKNYTDPEGLVKTLTPGVDGIVRVGETIPIRVSRSDPTVWTDRTEAKPWLTQLATPLLLLPVVLLSGLIVLWRRANVLRTWRDGQPIDAVVVDTKQSSIAPRSRVVRFVLKASEDRRVFSTLFPSSAGDLHKGDELLLLAPNGNPNRAIAAELYA